MIGLESLLNSAVQRASGTGAASSGGSAGAAASATQSFLDQGNFFELLTAQLSHQDPLSPADSTQFMSELAQLSTATGIRSLSQTVTGLGQEQQTNLRLRATALVGHDVGISGDALTLPAGNSAEGGYVLSSGAKQVEVTVTNAAGAVVDRMNLGAQGQGAHKFEWPGNGQAPGSYQFSVQALDASGSPVPAQTLSLARVSSVQVSPAGGVTLAFAGGTSAMQLDQVAVIF